MNDEAGREIDLGTFGGDARAASAAVEQWLADRPPAPPIGDVLVKMRAALEHLRDAPVLRDDDVAMRIMNAMARCGDMEELAPLVDRLDARLMVLLGGGAEAGASSPTPPPERRRPVRTFLRL